MVSLFPALTSAPASAADTFDRCDMKLEIEKGEKLGPFMGVPYLMLSWSLAERVCHADHLPMVRYVEKMVKAEGCGPDTEISRDLKHSAIEMDKLSLAQILEITDPAVTDEAVKKEAESAVDQFGGCEDVLISRQNIVDQFGK